MTNRQFGIALVVVAAAGVLGGMASEQLMDRPANAQISVTSGVEIETGVIGIVEDGKFRRAGSEGAPARLTTIQMQAAVSPEAGELDLTPYEGRAVMVGGLDGGGWIYEAVVIDSGGPLLTEVVREVYAE